MKPNNIDGLKHVYDFEKITIYRNVHKFENCSQNIKL